MFYFPETYKDKENSPSRYWVITSNGYCLPDGRKLPINLLNAAIHSHPIIHGGVVGQIVTNPMRIGQSVIDPSTCRAFVEGTEEYLEAERLTADLKTPLPVSSLIRGHEYLTADLKIIVWLGKMYRKSLRNQNGTLSIVNERVTCYSLHNEIHFIDKGMDVMAVRSLGSSTGFGSYGTHNSDGLVNDLVTKNKIPDTFTLTMVPYDYGVTRVIDDMLCLKKDPSSNEYYVLDNSLQYRKTITTTNEGQAVDLILNFGLYSMDVHNRALLKYCQEAEKALTNG